MNIYEAICNVMSEIGAIEKSKKNQQQGFMYRGVDEVMNALQPLLVKYKVFIVPEVLEQTREERTTKTGNTVIYSVCKVKYTFYADDGSFVQAVVVGEGMDSGDKATNKSHVDSVQIRLLPDVLHTDGRNGRSRRRIARNHAPKRSETAQNPAETA